MLTNLYKDENGHFHWKANIHSINENKKRLFEEIKLKNREPYEGETLFIGGEESNFLR